MQLTQEKVAVAKAGAAAEGTIAELRGRLAAQEKEALQIEYTMERLESSVRGLQAELAEAQHTHDGLQGASMPATKEVLV